MPDAADIARWWPRPAPTSTSTPAGVAGVATGSPAFPGAALMSVAGALAGPGRHGPVRGRGRRRRRPGPPVGRGVARGWPTAGRVQAWLCGCGLGTDERAQRRAARGARLVGAGGARRRRADAARRRLDGDLAAPPRRADGGDPARPGVHPDRRRAGRARTGSRRRGSSPRGWASWCCSRATARSWPRRTAPRGRTRPARRRWPPPAPVTCWPVCSSRCWRPGCRRTGRPSPAAFVHGLAGRRAADDLGGALAPVTAPDVAGPPRGHRDPGMTTRHLAGGSAGEWRDCNTAMRLVAPTGLRS